MRQQQEASVEECSVLQRLQQAWVEAVEAVEGPSALRLSRQLQECSAVGLGRQRGERLVVEGSVRLALETLEVLNFGSTYLTLGTKISNFYFCGSHWSRWCRCCRCHRRCRCKHWRGCRCDYIYIYIYNIYHPNEFGAIFLVHIFRESASLPLSLSL